MLRLRRLVLGALSRDQRGDGLRQGGIHREDWRGCRRRHRCRLSDEHRGPIATNGQPGSCAPPGPGAGEHLRMIRRDAAAKSLDGINLRGRMSLALAMEFRTMTSSEINLLDLLKSRSLTFGSFRLASGQESN